jgi:phospholipase/carboxylesterase
MSETEILEAVEVGPPEGAGGSVIWLHGLGASGHDFEDLVPLLGRPEVRFVFPHAPRRAVTVNMGLIMPAWYDIRSLGGAVRDEDDAGIRASAQLVTNLIRRENSRGVPSGKIVLAGFSQGGALALFTGMRHPDPLAGLMILSAYELLPETRDEEASDANRTTPLLLCHGDQDPVVPVQLGRAAFDAYATRERPAEKHEFPMPHAVCEEEVGVIRDWLAARF